MISAAQFQMVPMAEVGMSGSHVDYAHTVANYENALRESMRRLKRSDIEGFDEMHKTAKKIGRGNASVGAGILSTLSPEAPWEDNIRMAEEIAANKLSPAEFEELSTGNRAMLKGLKLNRQPTSMIMKAHKIHTGELDPLDPRTFSEPKTHHFTRSIADPNDPTAMTVDYRVHDIGIGARLPVKAVRGLGSVNRYNYFADAARQAGRTFGFSGPETQNMLWTYSRRQGYGRRRNG